jgi:hypothetical protein
MKPTDLSWLVGAAFVLALPAQVMAQASLAPQDTASTVAQSAERSGFAGFDKPVEAARLEAYRGGREVVINDMTLAGTTANNTAINVATGTNAISAGAFSNMSGMPMVIQNSGANVLIQNAVILNLQVN